MAKAKKDAGNGLRPGDLVRLKSGGPVMTVERPIGLGDRILCCWFDEEIRVPLSGLVALTLPPGPITEPPRQYRDCRAREFARDALQKVEESSGAA